MKAIQLRLPIRAALAIVLLLVGFAAGFPVGRSTGFIAGSEWALVQADFLAREAGVFMPVNYKEGTFHVVVKQPRRLQKAARERADRHEEGVAYGSSGDSALIERIEVPFSKLQGIKILEEGTSSYSLANPAASSGDCARPRIQLAQKISLVR